jgi:hypothetical protein
MLRLITLAVLFLSVFLVTGATISTDECSAQVCTNIQVTGPDGSISLCTQCCHSGTCSVQCTPMLGPTKKY